MGYLIQDSGDVKDCTDYSDKIKGVCQVYLTHAAVLINVRITH